MVPKTIGIESNMKFCKINYTLSLICKRKTPVQLNTENFYLWHNWHTPYAELEYLKVSIFHFNRALNSQNSTKSFTTIYRSYVRNSNLDLVSKTNSLKCWKVQEMHP